MEEELEEIEQLIKEKREAISQVDLELLRELEKEKVLDELLADLRSSSRSSVSESRS